MVSLVPAETFKNRPNGLRRDLMELLAATKPSFLRFPGGSLVSSGPLENGGWRWKDTIGDIAQRQTNDNLTQDYRKTWGLGYHEYLQMAEDLGAEPVFTVHSGVTSDESIRLNRLGPWVQDAVDAIEYANGPATSRWGAERRRTAIPGRSI